MRKFSFLAIFALVLSFAFSPNHILSAQASIESPNIGKNPQKLVAKAWRVDVPAFEAQMKEMVQMQMSMLQDALREAEESGDEEHAEEIRGQMAMGQGMVEQMMDAMMETMTNLYFDFKPNGDFEAGGGEETNKGTWKISKDGRNFSTTDASGSVTEFQVIELTSNKFVIFSEDMKLTFIPK